MLQPWCHSRKIMPIPHYASPSSIMIAFEHTASYPILFQQYDWYVILVFVRIIRSKLPICATRTASANLEPWLSHMCYLLRENPRDHDRQCGGGTLWGRSLPWLLGLVTYMVIWSGSSKICLVSTCVGSTVDMDPDPSEGTPIASNSRGRLK